MPNIFVYGLHMVVLSIFMQLLLLLLLFCLFASNLSSSGFALSLYIEVSQLVTWCFGLSKPQRIMRGLKTNFSLSPSFSFQKSLHHKSLFLKPQLISTISERKPRKTITHVLEPIYIPRALNTGTCISCL